jgi:DMSO reductase anchor subunit
MPREVTRPDSMPIKYSRDDKAGFYKPQVDRQSGKEKHWNLGRLSSRENPLVAFTLISQAAIGLVLMLPMVAAEMQSAGLFLGALLAGGGLLLSATHLGKPFRAYRGFNNLRHSPMAREGLACALFMGFTGVAFLASLPSHPVASAITSGATVLANVAGLAGLYYMVRCYLIKARPFWNHWQTGTSFVAVALYLGAMLAGFLSLGEHSPMIAGIMLTGLLLESAGLYCHQRAMRAAESEGAVSHYVQCTTFGRTYWLRNSLLATCVLGSLLWLLAQPQAGLALFGWSILCGLVLLQSVIGRALFYVLVTPTTMPGAFFWKNKAFEQHARDIGLANMPQVGVAAEH